MADEILRLQATVVDRSTGPLRSIADSVRRVARDTSGLNRGFGELNRTLANFTREAGAGFSQLAGFPLLGAGVVGSLTGIGLWLDNVAKKSVGLTYMTKELNFSRKALKEWEAVGKDLQIEQPIEGLKKFSDMMFQLKNNTTEGQQIMKWMAQREIPGLAAAMKQAAQDNDYEKALGLLQRALANLSDEQKRAYLAQYFFGSTEYGRMQADAYADALRNHGPIYQSNTDELKKYNDTMNQFWANVERLKAAGAEGLIVPLNKMYESIQKNGIGGATDEFFRSNKPSEITGIWGKVGPLPGTQSTNKFLKDWWNSMTGKGTTEVPDKTDTDRFSKTYWEKFMGWFKRTGLDSIEGNGGFAGAQPVGFNMPGGGGGGFQRASFSIPGSGGNSSVAGFGAAREGGGTPNIPGDLTPNSAIASDRARFAEEMKSKPWLRTAVAAMMHLEGARDPVPVVESLMNRMNYAKKSLESGLGIGNPKSFYGPIRRGQLPGVMAMLQKNPALMGKYGKAIDAALAGSDIIRGATDQGMISDPNGRWPGGRIMRDQVFNDWGGGPGGHAGAARWREEHRRRAAEARLNAALGKGILDGTITGSASIDVNVRAPKGTTVDATADGLFKVPKINRTNQMGLSDDFETPY